MILRRYPTSHQNMHMRFLFIDFSSKLPDTLIVRDVQMFHSDVLVTAVADDLIFKENGKVHYPIPIFNYPSLLQITLELYNFSGIFSGKNIMFIIKFSF